MRRDAKVNRDRILDAADDVFGEHGAGSSTEAVAGRAGVGIATVFRHFPTKDDLIAATLVRHFERLQALVESYADRPDPGDALFELLATMIRQGATKLNLAAQLPPDAVAACGVEAAAKRLHSHVDALLGRARLAGAVRPEVTVDELYLLLRALAAASAQQPPPAATLNRTIDLICEGIRSPAT